MKALFWLWPLGAFYNAFKHFRNPTAPNIIWAFTVFFGFTLAYAKEAAGSDIYSYIGELKELYLTEYTLKDFWRYYQSTGEVDVLRSFLAITISRFTDAPYILTAVYGLIFGFFFSRNIFYVYKKTEGKLSMFVLGGMIILPLIIPIWSINGFRYNTAVHVFLYGLLPYLFEGNKKRLWWSFITPFIFHFTFLLPAVVLGLFLIFGNRYVLYFYLFIGTLFIAESNIGALTGFASNYLPTQVLDRASGYTNEDKVRQYQATGGIAEDTRWYVIYYRKVLQYFALIILVSLFLYDVKQYRNDRLFLTLFSAALLFYALANLLSLIPSGIRFYALSNFLGYAFFIVLFNKYKLHRNTTFLVRTLAPALVIYMVIAFRDGLYFISIMTLIANPIIVPFITDYFTSVNDYIKDIYKLIR